MTREEAIKMLRGMKADNLNLNDLYTRDKYEALVMAIKALEQEPRWIPVSERLPEEETDVLVCNSNGEIEISSGAYSTEVNDFIWYTSGWKFGKVIAWMPLFEPYKAESEGK